MGKKCLKSRGNVVEPLDTIEKYGADSLRFYLVSMPLQIKIVFGLKVVC